MMLSNFIEVSSTYVVSSCDVIALITDQQCLRRLLESNLIFFIRFPTSHGTTFIIRKQRGILAP